MFSFKQVYIIFIVYSEIKHTNIFPKGKNTILPIPFLRIPVKNLIRYLELGRYFFSLQLF